MSSLLGSELPSLMREYIRGDPHLPPENPADIPLSQIVQHYFFLKDHFGSDSDMSSESDDEDSESAISPVFGSIGQKTSFERKEDRPKRSDEMYRPSQLPPMDLTPLKLHSGKGHHRIDKLQLLRSLIQSGLHDTRARDYYGNTAMHWACQALNATSDIEEYTLRLLRRGHREEHRGTKESSSSLRQQDGEKQQGPYNLIDLQAGMWRQITQRQYERRNRCLALIEMLQDNGGSQIHQNYEGMSPLHFSARTCDDALLADMLIHGHQKSKTSMQIGMAEIFESVRDASMKLLECERVTLFLADSSTSTLWSVVADQSIPIRISWAKGLAGSCFMSMETLNIADVHADPRFDSRWDRKSGFSTKNMLITPILNKRSVHFQNFQKLRTGSRDNEGSKNGGVKKKGQGGRVSNDNDSLIDSGKRANAVFGVIQCLNKKRRNYDPECPASGKLNFDSAEDTRIIEQIASHVATCINNVMEAWSLGGGKTTREKQEEEETQLRRKLQSMLRKKWIMARRKAGKIRARIKEGISLLEESIHDTEDDQYARFKNFDPEKMEAFMTEYVIGKSVKKWTDKDDQDCEQIFDREYQLFMGENYSTDSEQRGEKDSFDSGLGELSSSVENTDRLISKDDVRDISAAMIFEQSCASVHEVAMLSQTFKHSGPNRYINPKKLRHDASHLLEDGAQARRRTCRSGLSISLRPTNTAREELLFINKNVAIDARSADGSTALMIASETGNIIFIHYLLEAGASPYAVDREGSTALHYAALMNHTAVVKLLVGVGCDPFQVNDFGRDAEAEAKRGASTGSLRIIRGAKAIWLRVARGTQENCICKSRGTRCELTFGTPAESLISRCTGICRFCGERSEPSSFNTGDSWPHKVDNFEDPQVRQKAGFRNKYTKSDGNQSKNTNLREAVEARYAIMERRERELRLDADTLQFWLNRGMRPLDHLECAKIAPHRVMTHDMQKVASGFPGSRVGGFIVKMVENRISSRSIASAANDKDKLVMEEEDQEYATRTLRVQEVSCLSKELPRGWRCISFIFKKYGVTQRLRKRLYKNGDDKPKIVIQLVDRQKTPTKPIKLDMRSESEDGVTNREDTRANSKEIYKIADNESVKMQQNKRLSIRKSFRSKLKAVRASQTFKSEGTARKIKFANNESSVFTSMTSFQTSAEDFKDKYGFAMNSSIDSHIGHNLEIPVDSTCVILTKSGDPSRWGNNVMSIILPPNLTFIHPFATYRISIEAGAFFACDRHPLSSGEQPTPSIETYVKVDGSRISWDRITKNVLGIGGIDPVPRRTYSRNNNKSEVNAANFPLSSCTKAISNADAFRMEVLREIAHGTSIRSKNGMLSNSYTVPIHKQAVKERTSEETENMTKAMLIFPLRWPPRLVFGEERGMKRLRRHRKYFRWSFIAQSWVAVEKGSALKLIDAIPQCVPNSTAYTSWNGLTAGSLSIPNVHSLNSAPILIPGPIKSMDKDGECNTDSQESILSEPSVTSLFVEPKDGFVADIHFVHVPVVSHLEVDTSTEKDDLSTLGCGTELHVRLQRKIDEYDRKNSSTLSHQGHDGELRNDWIDLIEYSINLDELHSNPCMPDPKIFPELYTTPEGDAELETIETSVSLDSSKSRTNQLDKTKTNSIKNFKVSDSGRAQLGIGLGVQSKLTRVKRCIKLVPRTALHGVHERQLIEWDDEVDLQELSAIDSTQDSPRTSPTTSTAMLKSSPQFASDNLKRQALSRLASVSMGRFNPEKLHIVKVEGDESMLSVSDFAIIFGENQNEPETSADKSRLRKEASKRTLNSFLGSSMIRERFALSIEQLSEPTRVSLWPPRYAVQANGDGLSDDATVVSISAALVERTKVQSRREGTTEWIQLLTDRLGLGTTVLFNPFTCE